MLPSFFSDGFFCGDYLRTVVLQEAAKNEAMFNGSKYPHCMSLALFLFHAFCKLIHSDGKLVQRNQINKNETFSR